MSGAIGTVWRTAAVLIVVLALADIVGVIVCTLFDITPLRFNSVMLPYAIWLVLGIFAGFFSYGFAGTWASPEVGEGIEWTAGPGAARTGAIIVATSGAVIGGLMVLFYRLYWSQGVAGEFFVPDSAPHSIVFFLAAFGAIAGAHFLLKPAAPGSAV
jgi:hypothetical protein